MATITYKGSRSYLEYTSALSGQTIGWTPERTVEDVPEDMAMKMRNDTSGQWVVIEDGVVAKAETTKKMAAIVEVDDSTNDESPFNPNWSRGEMIKWFSARGESTPRTSTKASLTARAEAMMNPPAEEESSEDDE
tara:strand:- start:196 stop:600 length:405 start_codon:yes stop_codon:yes gene_type:complete